MSYVDGDVSSSTTSVSALAGLNWVSHLSGDIAIVPWALVNTATPTLDAGLTSSANVVDTNLRGIIGTDITSGSESGAFSLTCDGASANRMSAALALYRGYTGIEQIVSLGEASGTAQTSHTSPTITPHFANSHFVLVFMERVGSTVAPAGTPAGFTKRQEFSTGGTGGTSVVIYDDQSGTHGTSAWTPANVVSLTASTSAIVFLIELPVASESHTGTVGTSGSGTLSFTATPAHTGTDALTGSGTLSGTATPAIPGAAALSGSGQLSSTAVVAVSGSLALSGSGQVAGTGKPAAGGSLGLSGSGTASDTGAPAVSGPAALAGTGTLTETGTPATRGTAALTGSGTLGETGSPAFARPAAFSGAGSLATAGQPALPGNLQLAGGGTLQGLGGNTFGGSVALAGSGALGLAGKPAVADTHSFSAIGHLDFTASLAVTGGLGLAGGGALTAVGVAGFSGDLALAGAGALGLDGMPAAAGNLVLAGAGAFHAVGVTAPASTPGHLVASISQSPTATDASSVLTASTESTSRLEASDGV